jgi:hypothetical protein
VKTKDNIPTQKYNIGDILTIEHSGFEAGTPIRATVLIPSAKLYETFWSMPSSAGMASHDIGTVLCNTPNLHMQRGGTLIITPQWKVLRIQSVGKKGSTGEDSLKKTTSPPPKKSIHDYTFSFKNLEELIIPPISKKWAIVPDTHISAGNTSQPNGGEDLFDDE